MGLRQDQHATVLHHLVADWEAAQRAEKRHLVVMVHGLFGSAANWRVISGFLEEQLDPRTTLLHVSSVNQYTKVRACLLQEERTACLHNMLCSSCFASCSHPDYIRGSRRLQPKRPHALAPFCRQTYEGIDMCGERLADELRAVVVRHPNLERISILGHSMGGLIARYAAGTQLQGCLL